MNHNPKLPNNEHSTIYPLGHSESIKVYESKSDVDIWNAFNKGDEIAFNYIYRMYVTVLFKYGCQMSRDHNHIQDCIHNIFIDLRRKRGQLNEVQSIKAYLFKILYRELIRKSNKKRRPISILKIFLIIFQLNFPRKRNSFSRKTRKRKSKEYKVP